MSIEKKLDAIAESIMETDDDDIIEETAAVDVEEEEASAQEDAEMQADSPEEREEDLGTEIESGLEPEAVDSDEEVSEQAKPANDVDPVRVVEAMLFASAEPLSPAAMHERLPEGTDLGAVMEQLKEKYAGGGVELRQVGKNWAFRTAADVESSLTVEKEVERKLSKAALETLAIIAYHQPITRAEVENIRGVATHKGTLDALMEMDWIKPGRRRETPGRPLTWVTTDNFLDHFQLESLRDLPGMDDLKAAGLLDTRPAIETVPDTRDLFDDADQDAEEVLDAADEQGGDAGTEDAYDMPQDTADEEEDE